MSAPFFRRLFRKRPKQTEYRLMASGIDVTLLVHTRYQEATLYLHGLPIVSIRAQYNAPLVIEDHGLTFEDDRVTAKESPNE